MNLTAKLDWLIVSGLRQNMWKWPPLSWTNCSRHLTSSICQLQPLIGDAEGEGRVCRCAPDSTPLLPCSMVVFLMFCQQYFSYFVDCISSPGQWQPKIRKSRRGNFCWCVHLTATPLSPPTFPLPSLFPPLEIIFIGAHAKISVAKLRKENLLSEIRIQEGGLFSEKILIFYFARECFTCV